MICVYYYDFPTPIGRLGIAGDGCGITNIFPAERRPPESPVERETPQIKEAAKQLTEYFSGKRRDFDLPLSLHGTAFQTQVWAALTTIPYGQTRSYKDIAIQTGRLKAFQAVGQANTRNPLPFVIPCHRVIAADGSLGGYALGLELKQWLLELEQENNR